MAAKVDRKAGARPARRQVAGRKGGSSKPKQPSIASNSVPSISTARMVYLWSWGPIVGPVAGLRSVKLDGTPIEAEDGTVNYPGVKWQFRSGELNQERLTGVSESSNEIAISQELRSTTPWVYSINNAVIDAVRVRFSWPVLQAQDSSGNINGVRIDYAVDVSTDGGPYVEVLTSYVQRKNVTKYERSHRIELPQGSRWTIRARRLTAEANSSLVQDSMVVEAIAEVVDSDQEYPLTSVSAVEYDAQQFGGDFPKIAVLMRGRIVRVPMNYDPETRTYATSGAGTSGGIWDGSFKEAYTNNPAWVFYDLVLHPYYGLGDRIDASMINRWALYRIAQRCDQMVPDGKGGEEPRFTCNLYLQKQAEAWAVLQDLAAIFHGLAYWDGSQIIVNADMPQDPVYTYTMSQILGDGAINYTGSRLRDRHSLAMVSFDDPDQAFETDKEPVFDEDAQAEYGIREMSVEAVGCTSRGQAQRAGQWALLSEQLQLRGANFSVGLDGFIPKPGTVIALSDPMLAGRANGGRIASVAGRVVTLDRDVEVPTVARLLVNLPSGKTEARQVRSVSGRQITVMADYSEAPQPESAWALDYDDLKLMQFYVRNVTRPDWTRFQLDVVQHEPSKFDAIDYGAMIDDRPISVLPPGIQDAPARVLISSHEAISQGLAVTTMTIAWDAAPGAVAYDVEWRWGARDWVKVPRTGELMVDVTGVYAGQYLARVRAVNAMDVSSIPTTSMLTDIAGKTTPPPAVSFLRTASEIFGIRLEWGVPAGAEDTAYTQLEMSSESTGQNPVALGQFAYPTSTYLHSGMAAGVVRWFRARLVDRTGNIGPWSDWIYGQSSADANEILDYITGKITETHLGQSLLSEIEKIPGLQEQIDALDGLKGYIKEDPYEQGQMVVVDGRIYQAKQDVPADPTGASAPPNATYWVDVGQSLTTANGLAQQVATNTAGITDLDGKVTAQVTAFEALRAAYRDDDGEGELADALKGWDSTAAIATAQKVQASDNMAMAERVTTLDARVAGNETSITDLDRVVTTNETANATKISQLSSRVGSTEALIQDTSEALVDLNGDVSATRNIKVGVDVNGVYYGAGMGIGVENTPDGMQSMVVFLANLFAVMHQPGGTPKSVFAIQNGQVFMNSAIINQADIINLIITGELKSSNYVAGSQGIRINFVTNEFEINGVQSGVGRMNMTHQTVTVYDSTRMRVRLGIWS